MSVSLEKLPGVESVRISLNQGRASVSLLPNNAVTLEQMTQIVKDKGFTPWQAHVVARGELKAASGKLQLGLPKISRIYELVVNPQTANGSSALRESVGKLLVVEGVIPLTPGQTPPPLLLQDFRPAP